MEVKYLRYRYDDPGFLGLDDRLRSPSHAPSGGRSALLSGAVHVTPELFPTLAPLLDQVGNVLGEAGRIDGFVYGDPAMQAGCVTHGMRTGTAEFSVSLSSGLVERLEPDELKFVIGHEVGHHVFEHWRYPDQDDADESMGSRLAALHLRRAAEISADRVGVVACGSIESACSAMIKVASGLGPPHFQPNVVAMLAQFRQFAESEGRHGAVFGTHPIIPLRVRSLLRFQPFWQERLRERTTGRHDLGRIDDAIERDFQRSSGFALEEMASAQLGMVRVWGLVALFCADGILDRQEQRVLEGTLEPEVFAEVMKVLRHAEHRAPLVVKGKLSECCATVRMLPMERREEAMKDIDDLLTAAGSRSADTDRVMRHLASSLGLDSAGQAAVE